MMRETGWGPASLRSCCHARSLTRRVNWQAGRRISRRRIRRASVKAAACTFQAFISSGRQPATSSGRAVAMNTWCMPGRHLLQPPGAIPVQLAEDVVEEQHRPDPALLVQHVAARQDQGDGRRAGLALGSEDPQIQPRPSRTSKSSNWGPISGLPAPRFPTPQYSPIPPKYPLPGRLFRNVFPLAVASGGHRPTTTPGGDGRSGPGSGPLSARSRWMRSANGVSSAAYSARPRHDRRRVGGEFRGSRPPVRRAASPGRGQAPLQVAQQTRLLLQGPLEGRQVGQVGGVDLGHALVGELAPPLGAAPHQADAVGVEEDGDQAAHQVGAAPHRLRRRCGTAARRRGPDRTRRSARAPESSSSFQAPRAGRRASKAIRSSLRAPRWERPRAR